MAQACRYAGHFRDHSAMGHLDCERVGVYRPDAYFGTGHHIFGRWYYLDFAIEALVDLD